MIFRGPEFISVRAYDAALPKAVGEQALTVSPYLAYLCLDCVKRDVGAVKLGVDVTDLRVVTSGVRLDFAYQLEQPDDALVLDSALISGGVMLELPAKPIVCPEGRLGILPQVFCGLRRSLSRR